MTRITYVEHDGTERSIEAEHGFSVMEVARNNDVPGIVADCGGACACATCHVHVDPAWVERVGPAGKDEQAMLEFASECAPNSRLSCQIRVTPALDGLVVRTPEHQG